MRKRTKRKVKKILRWIILLILIFLAIVVFIIKPGNPFTTNIKLNDSKTFSKFELRRVTLLSMKEFLKVPGRLKGITYDEKKNKHERLEWAKIYNKDKDDIVVLYIHYKTYKDASKKNYKNNYDYKASWVFVKNGKKWVFKSK